MSSKNISRIVGTVIVSIALILAVVPLERDTGSRMAPCGSALAPKMREIREGIFEGPVIGTETLCGDEINGRRSLSLIIAGLGVLVFFFGDRVVKREETSSDLSTQHSQSDKDGKLDYFCSACDTQVPEEAQFCPACGKSFNKPECDKCGTQIQDEDKFCSGCGVAV